MRGLLIHHERAHTKDNTLKIASLGSIAKDFTPGWLSHLALNGNTLQDLVELSFDLWIVIVLVEESSNHMSSFIVSPMLGEPSRCLANERTAE